MLIPNVSLSLKQTQFSSVQGTSFLSMVLNSGVVQAVGLYFLLPFFFYRSIGTVHTFHAVKRFTLHTYSV